MNRLKELVHYICSICKDDPDLLGATKLNKALWYIDTFAFLSLGQSISGETEYVKKPYGPVPQGILNILGILQKEKAIVIKERKHHKGIKRTYIVLEAPDDSVFTIEEKEIIKDITQAVCRHTAQEISELSHTAAWEAAKDGAKIPLYAILAVPDKITRKDEARFLDFLLSRHS